MSQNCDCSCGNEQINVPVTGITMPLCGFGVNIDASKLPRCECRPDDGYEQSLARDGWVKLPNGLIMQWGHAQGEQGTPESGCGKVVFPIPFPNECLNVTLTERSIPPLANVSIIGVNPHSLSRTGFEFAAVNPATGTGAVGEGGFWQAIGY